MNYAYSSPVPQIDGRVFKIFMRKKLGRTSGLGDFWNDLGDFFTDGIAGLGDGINRALNEIVHTVEQIGETIALILRACVGDVDWSDVLDSVGDIFQHVGTFMVITGGREIFNWLKSNDLTGHMFQELDKFTGGMLTSATNLSDLPGRVLRGDAIPKEELVADALLIIQIVAIIYAGPVGVGLMVGMMVGKEICSKQTEYKEACMAAFEIVGAAIGSWAGSYYDVDWGTAYWDTDNPVAEDGSDFIPGDDVYNQAIQAGEDSSSTSFFPHLSAAATEYLEKKGIDKVTQQAIALCEKTHTAGNNECKILGQIARDYVETGSDESWEDFLSTEIAKIGAEQLMLQWFPATSKEAAAIKKKWVINYVDAQPNPSVSQMNPLTWLILAGGAAALLIGGGS